MRKIISISICAVLAITQPLVLAASKEKIKRPVKPAVIKPLEKEQGYLLVRMDVAGVAPSLTVDRLRNAGELYLDATEKSRLMDEEFTIRLKDVEAGLYMIRLKAGLYQVTSVNVPYFNLPFRLDTSDSPSWRFSIAEGKTNYIGTLFVDQERSSKLVNVALFNRMATDKAEIKADLADLLAQAELRNGVGVRDDFTKILEAPAQ